MTAAEFNDKWKDHLETGHHGMATEIPGVIEFMDWEFEKELLANPTFEYSRIKLLYGFARVQTNTGMYKDTMWELVIDEIVKYIKSPQSDT